LAHHCTGIHLLCRLNSITCSLSLKKQKNLEQFLKNKILEAELVADHEKLKQKNLEQFLKSKILEAEKEQLTSQVKEINLKLELKSLQCSNLENKNQSSCEIPPMHRFKEQNIETNEISMPNIPSSKRKASCSEQDRASKLMKKKR